jgi:transcriptional regulator with XRE-family HTH domain
MIQKRADASPFGDTLRDLRHESGLSLRDLGEIVDLSATHLSRIETGQRSPPDRKKVIEIANAIGTREKDRDRLLELAGYAPETIADIPGIDLNDERLRRQLRLTAQLRTESLHAADLTETAVMLLLQGALHTEDIPQAHDEVVTTISSEEKVIDEALSDLIAGQCSQLDAVQNAFDGLPWELRRRIVEALPTIARQCGEPVVFQWAQMLRRDLDPEYGPDIRRRVVEGVPTLLQVYPSAIDLLEPMEGDNVFVHIAIAESAYDLGRLDEVRPTLQHEQLPEHAGVIEFLAGLLDQGADQAIDTIRNTRTEDRLFRIVCVRVLRRLLPEVPQEALREYLYFLRRRAGRPAEHPNVRRPAAIAIPELTELLDTQPLAYGVLQRLAEENDVFIRRAVGDSLDRIGDPLVQMLVDDPDPYIRRRAWAERGKG